MFLSRALKFFLIAILVCVFAVAAYAYAAANIVPSGKAGAGAGAISGYTISDDKYPIYPECQQPAKYRFRYLHAQCLTGRQQTVKVKLVDAGSTWYTCTHSGAQVTCGSAGSPLGAPVLQTGNSLHVVIAD